MVEPGTSARLLKALALQAQLISSSLALRSILRRPQLLLHCAQLCFQLVPSILASLSQVLLDQEDLKGDVQDMR